MERYGEHVVKAAFAKAQLPTGMDLPDWRQHSLADVVPPYLLFVREHPEVLLPLNHINRYFQASGAFVAHLQLEFWRRSLPQQKEQLQLVESEDEANYYAELEGESLLTQIRRDLYPVLIAKLHQDERIPQQWHAMVAGVICERLPQLTIEEEYDRVVLAEIQPLIPVEDPQARQVVQAIQLFIHRELPPLVQAFWQGEHKQDAKPLLGEFHDLKERYWAMETELRHQLRRSAAQLRKAALTLLRIRATCIAGLGLGGRDVES